MKNKHSALFLKLASGFFLNTAAAWFFVIFISPEGIGKLNAAAACIACFLATYVLELLSDE
jgi:hypothetical protein